MALSQVPLQQTLVLEIDWVLCSFHEIIVFMSLKLFYILLFGVFRTGSFVVGAVFWMS